MADLRITELSALASADLAATDPLPVADLSASTSKKITAKDFVQKAVTLIDDASIPSAKVNFSGISGTNLTDGTVTAVKLNTSSIPATGGLAVSSGNLGLVAPTSPIQRNGSTGSLEHANSTVASGVWTKVTVDAKGHVTSGTTLLGTDVPLATASVVGVISPGTGLSVTGAGVLNHSNSLASGITVNGVTVDQQGHVTGIVALASTDLPKASAGVPGAVSPGTGTSVSGAGALSVTAATSSALGGVIVGGDFAVSTGTISLATQAGLAAGAYPKVTVTTKGIITAGASLVASDIPNLDVSKLTTGTLSVSLLGTNSITGAKLANYSTIKFGGAGSTSGIVTFPTPEFTGQGFFDSTNGDFYIFDGNTWQPLTVISGDLVYAGTYNGSTNRVASVTTAGTAAGLVIGSALPAGSASLLRYYVVVSESGNGVSPAPVVALAPPDMIICNGATWDLVDVSNAIAGQTATNISFTPYGNLAATNVQTALQELDDEKIAKAGGVVTGELLIGSAGTFGFEGSTNNAYETYLSVVDPTADRAIVFPDQSGNVIVSGNASIVNADINASAGIVDTKLATIATAGKVSNSATTAANTNTASAIVARDSSGNFSAGTITATLTGTASSATALATARTIQGVSFDGTANITVATAGSGISVTGTAIANTGVLSVNGNAGAITNIAATNAVQSFTVAQRGTITALTDGATITPDFAAANNFSVTLGGSRTLANPTNLTAGQSGTIVITQDGTGSRTLAYGGYFKFAGGTAPTLTTTAAAVDVIAYYVESSTRITARILNDVK